MKNLNPLSLFKKLVFSIAFIIPSLGLNAQCTANFGYSTCVNGNLQFWNSSTGTSTQTAFVWNFGDNTNAYTMNPSHTYSANGIYTVCLNITDSANFCTSAICKTVNINCITTGSCNANFTFSNCVNGTMQFWNMSTNVSNQTAYSWNFGDNTFGFGNNPSHTYTANGTYSVCLSLTDSLNMCTSTLCKTVAINCIAASTCTANFSYSTCVGGNMQFFSTSTGVGNFTNYSWSFGDSSFGSGQNPNHTYSANSIYTVCLTITDSAANCNSTICKPVNISCISSGSCVANFTDSTCLNGNVFFYNLSSGTNTNTIYNWNFGDGGNSNQLHPTHTYTSNGQFIVCLTISDSTTNCYNTKCYTITVNCVPASIKSNFMSSSDLSVYPNPTNGLFTIEVKNENANNDKLEVIIFNMLGQEVSNSINLDNKHSAKWEIDIGILPEGPYFIKVGNNGNYQVKKIILTK